MNLPKFAPGKKHDARRISFHQCSTQVGRWFAQAETVAEVLKLGYWPKRGPSSKLPGRAALFGAPSSELGLPGPRARVAFGWGEAWGKHFFGLLSHQVGAQTHFFKNVLHAKQGIGQDWRFCQMLRQLEGLEMTSPQN